MNAPETVIQIRRIHDVKEMDAGGDRRQLDGICYLAACSDTHGARGWQSFLLRGVNGPADVTFRQFTSQPGEVGPWHFHPGAVHNIVTAGSITIEDGCGGEQTYSAGQGWEQLDGRVHRWKNLGTTAEAEFNTFIVPEGSPTTDVLPSQHCGPPTVVTECQRGGWTSFDFPAPFADQAACANYVRKHIH